MILKADARALPIKDETVDAVVTDPPYNVGFAYDVHSDRMPEPEYLDWLRSCFQECARVLKPDGALVWFWQGIRVANGEARACLPNGWRIHHLGAWFKQEFAGDLWKGAHPAFSWEPIIWAVRSSASPVYYGPKGGHGARDGIVGNHVRHDLPGPHPCPKTLSVVKKVVDWVTPPGGTVLDPFSGSATTVVAAIETGRKGIGVEKSLSYCAESRARIHRASPVMAELMR